jgi:pyrroline-5-carboxylate reductase
MISQRIAIIGGGRMGETLTAGLLSAGIVAPSQITVTGRSSLKLTRFAAVYGVSSTTDNAAAVAQADIVLLCVKPQMADEVLDGIAASMAPGKLLISIMAGKRIPSIESKLPAGSAVVRAMPNTPSQVMEGMTAVAAGTHATDAHLELAHSIFGSVGRCITLAERHFDAVTALSASGPAFIYIVIEALAEGGVKSGLPRDVSTELAAQMTLGAAKMVIQTGQHPAILKDHVTTPGGCTIDGILKLEEGGLRVTLIKAVTEATKRACELG